MLFRAKFYENNKPLFAVTLRNCDYKDIKNHFVSLTYLEKKFRVLCFEVDESGRNERLIADHIL